MSSTIAQDCSRHSGSSNLVADSAQTTGLKWAAPSSSLTTAYVNTTTSQGTTSTSYTDLATVTSVTLTTGTKALVFFGANVAPGNAGYMSIAISGASSVSATDDNSVIFEGAGLSSFVFRSIEFTGLTAGSNTFTAKFRANASTANYARRVISVIDLGS